MKPNIALSLSFEGISLLCRVENGWHRLGDASLASDDLGAELEALRALAEEVDGADFRTKLILPNDQIKYLHIETGRGSRAKREAAATDALLGATPYRVEDLAFDVVADGRKTHVAAVARETLAEAEAFAVENHFNPVSFVAIPPEGGYPNEPTFDLTKAASKLLNGEPLDADDDIIAVTGQGPLEAAPVPEPEPPIVEDPESIAEPKIPSDTVEAAAVAEPEATAEPRDEADAEELAPPVVPEVDLEQPEAPISTFSSIRARRDAPGDAPAEVPAKLGGVDRDVTGTNAPSVPPVASSGPHADAPLRFDPKSVVAGLRATPHSQDDIIEETESDSAPSSFFSRRGQKPAAEARAKPKKPVPLAEARPVEPTTSEPGERRNMAVFGARDVEIGGKPRHLGLILAVVLLVFLAVVAIWASLFTEDGIAGLLSPEPIPQIADLEAESQPTEVLPTETEALETVALPPVSPESMTDSAEIEAMEGGDAGLTDSAAVEAEQDQIHPTAPTPQEAEARYAVTGIWERAPMQPQTPPVGSTDTFYLTSIDRMLAVRDAVALPEETRDRPAVAQSNPVPYGTTFDLDERGLVRATPEGAMSPEGVMVYLGKPAVLPKSFPERAAEPGQSVTPSELIRLSKARPKARPDDLIEQNERASYGGLTLNELAVIRPRLRPESAKAKEERDTTPTAAAVATSARPRMRPSNMSQIVARATPRDEVVATPAAAIVTPSIPSSASVARQATITNAINLNKINLIGVYGTTSSRRALVRLSNGRYKKVQVGDRIDGGKVATISDTELRYVKSGKNVILKLPKG
ncbi:hypothetical protein [uncultured Shimia sp.]|uniref:hypothetical protein n=1 Tax=uncultured Shimia sp. TaxID=573152 RepID=UPI00263294C6|nr:hypothetical protein [uncultured Shimia sp.]